MTPPKVRFLTKIYHPNIDLEGNVVEREADELEALALASKGAQRSLNGAGVRKVIVRAPKLVNIVPDA